MFSRMTHLRYFIFGLFVFTFVYAGSTQADSQMIQRDVVDLLADDYMPTPSVLSETDIELYKRILHYQEKGSYSLADKSIHKLSDDVLMGYVLYHRYMGDHYRSTFSELQDWMRLYSDHPGAEQIYKLALKKGRHIKNVQSKVRQPQSAKDKKYGQSSGAEEYMIQYSYSNLSSSNRGYVKNKISQFKRALSKGWTKSARNILEDPKFRRYVNNGDLKRMGGYLSFSYYLDGQYELSKQFAVPSAAFGSEKGTYVMGLLAYRESNFVMAAKYFDYVSNKTSSQDLRAASSVFAAKSYDLLNDDSRADDAWMVAAKYPDTFYGMIAAVKMDVVPEYNWEDPDMSMMDAREILSYRGGMRAIAFLEIGSKKQASRELIRLLQVHPSKRMTETVLSFAVQEDLPSVSLQAAQSGYLANSDLYHSAMYPMPNWQPTEGWHVDKALVYAIVRQESRFKNNARSSAGAAGVMQIMPATASYIQKDRSLYRRNRSKLYNTSFNLSVGQNYIKHLMQDNSVQDDIIRMLAAYNAGPGNLRKFERKMGYVSDPLLYVESLPARETRNYVKHVLMNYWMYHYRMGHELKSLTALLDREFPVYAAVDMDGVHYAFNQ